MPAARSATVKAPRSFEQQCMDIQFFLEFCPPLRLLHVLRGVPARRELRDQLIEMGAEATLGSWPPMRHRSLST